MRACLCRLTAGAFLLIMAFLPLQAAADTGRVALVIGNGDYGAEIGRLRNPVNDAKLMARTLKQLGFAVTLALDVDQKQLKRAVRDFGEALTAAGSEGVGFFYYAGHGLQVDGENYLLPIGAHIEAERDVDLEAVSANAILAQMQYAGNGVNLIFLDACRNNPLSRSFRSTQRGLARVDAPRGSFVGYSTAPGDVSLDGDGNNSPYALALAQELLRPGEAIEEVHRAVRLQVLSATNQQQTPWDSSSLTATVTLAGARVAPVASVAPAPAPTVAPADGAAAERAWDRVKDNTNPVVLQAFLQQFPDGLYAALARDRLEKLTGDTQVAAVAAPAPAPVVTPVVTPAPTPPVAPEPIVTAGTASDADSTRTVVAPEDAGIVPMEDAYIAIKNANIRAKPEADAKIVGKVQKAEKVIVTGRTPDASWLQVTSAAGAGYISAKLLKADLSAASRTPAPAPAPPPVTTAPEPVRNALRISETLRPEIEKFLSNSKAQTGKYRFLAVNEAGDKIGLSIGCNIKKVGWGGYAVDGCGDEKAARQMALDDCGNNCKVIFKGMQKIGDFEIDWVKGDGSVETAALPAAEAEAVTAPVETTAGIAAPAPASTQVPAEDGGVVRIAENLRSEIEKYLSNSAKQTAKYRFLAVNAAGDKIGLSIGCNIKKWGWGGYAVDGCGDEAAARQIALDDCGANCRIIFKGPDKVGTFEIEWY